MTFSPSYDHNLPTMTKDDFGLAHSFGLGKMSQMEIENDLEQWRKKSEEAYIGQYEIFCKMKQQILDLNHKVLDQVWKDFLENILFIVWKFILIFVSLKPSIVLNFNQTRTTDQQYFFVN